MTKQYMVQAWAQMRQQPLMSAVTVAGTALSIFLIMIVVMMQEVKVAPFAPESHRDRFLHVAFMSITHENWGEGNTSNGPMSVRTAKECFQSLTIPEAVTVYLCQTMPMPVALPGQPSVSADVLDTDDVFFRVFDFRFVSGKPYDKATFEAGIPVAVITESIARSVFGSTDVVGREFLLSHAVYKVCGVVRDVSTLATTAYAQIWVPYTTGNNYTNLWNDGYMGAMSCTILAKDRSDFPAIRQEVERQKAIVDARMKDSGYRLIYRNRPYDQEKQAIAFGANYEPDLPAARRERWVVFAILLIVPAINLSSMTQSRLRQRVAEIGVRRAFGSSRAGVMGQLFAENMVVTLLAGALGFLLSVVFAYVGNSLLFAQEYSPTLQAPEVDASILIHLSTFLWAMLFCFLLNLFSTGIPAWRASRVNIVEAINGKC